MKPPILSLNSHRFDKRYRIELTPHEVELLGLHIRKIRTKLENPETYVRGYPAYENLPDGCIDIAKAIKDSYTGYQTTCASYEEMEQQTHAAIILGFRNIRPEQSIPNYKICHFIENNETFTHTELIECLDYAMQHFREWLTKIDKTWKTVGFFIPYNPDHFIKGHPLRKRIFYGKLYVLNKNNEFSKRPIKQNISYDECLLNVRILQDPCTNPETYKKYKEKRKGI